MKAGVGVSAENHVAGTICGAVIWVRGQVVKELVHGNIGGFSGCGLCREFVVNSMCIVEESTNDALISLTPSVGRGGL